MYHVVYEKEQNQKIRVDTFIYLLFEHVEETFQKFSIKVQLITRRPRVYVT